ncbi:MAG: hypothetical protein MUO34_05720 [Ignavibacteriaceae bacterium]|nr:hypothetical protein [Ignavibacteriaceae bacterium]
MRKIQLLVIVILSLIISSAAFAQEEPEKKEDKKEKGWKWEFNDFDFSFRKSQPTISLQYGLSKVQRDDLNLSITDPALFELKLGYIKDKKAWKTDDIVKHNFRYIFLSNISNDISGNDGSVDNLATNTWRFGFGRSSGYGYKLSESAAIIPYYTYTLNWSRVDFTKQDILTLVPDPNDDILNYYDESFRFGTSSEGGLRIKFIDNIALEAGYERAIVFQRHLFWKWAGSAVIEVAAQGLLDTFINEIFKSSPAAGPIVNFVLKNALAYGIYELRQEKMNWPFSSEPPLAFDNIKFGVTFVF